MIARKAPKLAAVALADKLARIAWKLMVSGEHYRPISASIEFTHFLIRGWRRI
ncbi:hypothetical protein X765_32290 [Mesorhizobium sp. LSHC440B00]|nr:hypothetical protein X765_32290 [Mesorhizobium sp. LSHC440B00]ESX29165.1 hypothetical protein X764_32010 [Mesorhizobium sp. LSHC440A00]